MQPPTLVPHAGELAALATACCWVVSALAFEASSRRIGSLSLNLVRLVFALVPLLVYNGVTRGLPVPVDAPGGVWFWMALSGLVGFVVGDLCLFRAFVVLGARLSMLVMALVPPLTALMGWLALGEEMGSLPLLAMALTVGGVAVVVLERVPASDGVARRPPASGLLLALGGAVGQAAGLILSKIGVRDFDAVACTEIRVLAGVAGFAALFVAVGWWPRTIRALRDGRAMALAGGGAFFGPFMGVSLSLVAVKYAHAGVAATIMALVPVLIIPAAVVLMHERVTRRALVGSFVAVGGSALLFA